MATAALRQAAATIQFDVSRVSRQEGVGSGETDAPFAPLHRVSVFQKWAVVQKPSFLAGAAPRTCHSAPPCRHAGLISLGLLVHRFGIEDGTQLRFERFKLRCVPIMGVAGRDLRPLWHIEESGRKAR
jgi:hypothetical protein